MSSSALSTIEAIIKDPKFADYLAILKGARNGLVYGVKIRFPHALLMSILFGRGDWIARAKTIFKATKTHALNLASFVTLYKTLLLIQRRINGGKERNSDTFFAGLIGGYIVFGDRTAINEQIVLYVCSRVVASFIPRTGTSNAPSPAQAKPITPDARLFSLFVDVSWEQSCGYSRFAERPYNLECGVLRSPLYCDSEKWSDLRTLLWHNK